MPLDAADAEIPTVRHTTYPAGVSRTQVPPGRYVESVVCTENADGATTPYYATLVDPHPIPTSISPGSVSVYGHGSQRVTITGTGFIREVGMTVTVGGVACGSIDIEWSSTLHCTLDSHGPDSGPNQTVTLTPTVGTNVTAGSAELPFFWT